MGKGALIAAAFVLATTMTMLFSAQLQSRETDELEYKRQANQVARELAMEGRKAVLASWIQSQAMGALPVQPFNLINRDGGRIFIKNFIPSGNTIDFTIQADYDSTVHEVRSRFAWQSFAVNPMQLNTWRIIPTISPMAALNIPTLGLDKNSVEELDSILVGDLGLITSLSDVSIGWEGVGGVKSTLEAELVTSGNSSLTPVDVIDATNRSTYESMDGIFFPDQVNQVVTEFAIAHPSEHLTVSDLSGLSGEFGISDGYQMLTVSENLTLSNNFTGKGILVVEGDLVVPTGVDFSWDGIILIKPPVTSMSPRVDFSGNVQIEGMFVTLQEVINTGHMDLSVMRDMSGSWPYASGTSTNVLKHTHDYTSHQGNYVVFHSDQAGAPNHESYTRFNETLGLLSAGDEIILELVNHTNHGYGIMQIDRVGESPVFQSVPAGFDSTLSAPGNVYRTAPFPPADLEHLDIAITRLSSLRKMWDNGSNYPGCSHNEGPLCVWYSTNRYSALTLRMYSYALGTETMVYEASLYWHRREDEEEEFNEDMTDLTTALQDPTNGLNLNVGANTSITADLSSILSLGPFNGIEFGADHLGTWHRQWAPDDAGNPLVSPY